MTHWAVDGNCVKVTEEFPGLADSWVSTVPEDVEYAKGVCADCPIAKLCLEKALSYRESWGVWGGIELRAGRVNNRERKQAYEDFGIDLTDRLMRGANNIDL